MTAALHDLHPRTDHPVLAGLSAIEEALDRMLVGAVPPLAPGDHAAAVRRVEQIGRRVEAVKLKLVAAADTAGTPSDAGVAGAEAWVASQTRTTRAEAAREVRLARDLETGEHDVTAAALDQGLVSSAHADVILRATRDLPDG